VLAEGWETRLHPDRTERQSYMVKHSKLKMVWCYFVWHKDKVVAVTKNESVILVCQRCGHESRLIKGSTLWDEWRRGIYP